MRRAAMFALLAVLVWAVSPTVASRSLTAQDATPCAATAEAENVAVARRWTEEALDGGNLAVLDEILAADIVYAAGVFPELRGRDAVKRALGALLTGFPDARFTVDQVIADGDVVAIRWTGRGTHEAAFLGVAPTGNSVEWTGINVYRIACGRIAEGWSEADGLGILRQVGALPAATPAP